MGVSEVLVNSQNEVHIGGNYGGKINFLIGYEVYLLTYVITNIVHN